MTEWNNLKYTLMEEIGENMDIVLFRYFPSTNKFQWYIRSHADMDGTGAWTVCITL